MSRRVICIALTLAAVAMGVLWPASHFVRQTASWRYGDREMRTTRHSARIALLKGKLLLVVARRDEWRPVSQATVAARKYLESQLGLFVFPDFTAPDPLLIWNKQLSYWGMLIEVRSSHCFDNDLQPIGEATEKEIVLRFPFWMLLILFSAYPAAAFIRGPFRRYLCSRKGLCLSCGYNLTGVQRRCPECGTPFGKPTVS